MKFLEQPPRFAFFSGKGGVGKASIACASAVHLGDAGKRVLPVSTDNELRGIDAVRRRHAGRYALVPLLPVEPVGVARLLQLGCHAMAQADVASIREPA